MPVYPLAGYLAMQVQPLRPGWCWWNNSFHCRFCACVTSISSYSFVTEWKEGVRHVRTRCLSTSQWKKASCSAVCWHISMATKTTAHELLIWPWALGDKYFCWASFHKNEWPPFPYHVFCSGWSLKTSKCILTKLRSATWLQMPWKIALPTNGKWPSTREAGSGEPLREDVEIS